LSGAEKAAQENTKLEMNMFRANKMDRFESERIIRTPYLVFLLFDRRPSIDKF
jgi:hypothetical protein